eukprot:Rhum_TRINITY_DN18585_c0_g1::Rhum_TRINITY_DN18585_c0_g1_i1::g.167782::m.167782
MSVTWNNRDLQECFCWSTSLGDWCTGHGCEDYGESRYGLAAPAVLLCGALLLFMVGYVIARLLGCLWCTAKSMCLTRCLICTPEGSPATVVKYYRVLLGALVFAGLALALAPLGQLKGTEDGLSDIAQEFDNLRYQVSVESSQWVGGAWAVYDELLPISLSNDPNIESAWGGVFETKHRLDDYTHALNTISNVLHYVQTGLRAVVWLPPVLALFVLAPALLNIHYCYPVFMTLILCLITPVFLSTQVVTIAAGKASEDLCDDFAGLSQFTYNYTTSRLSGSSAVTTASAVSDRFTRSFVSSVCTDSSYSRHGARSPIVDLCFNFAESQFHCTKADCNAAPTIAGFLQNSTHIDKTVVPQQDWSNCEGLCSIAQCATQCRQGSNVQILAAKAVSQATKAPMLISKMMETMTVAWNRNLVMKSFDNFQPIVCGNFADNTMNLSDFMAAQGALLLVITICCALGSYIYIGSRAREDARANPAALPINENSRLLASATPIPYAAAGKEAGAPVVGVVMGAATKEAAPTGPYPCVPEPAKKAAGEEEC